MPNNVKIQYATFKIRMKQEENTHLKWENILLSDVFV